jgi:hypothetical protein
MEADLSELPTGTGGWCSLIDHALSLGDLSEVDWLELKGSLRFGEKSERKHSAVVIARAVLGFSNRMPDAVRRHLGGYGVVLVGVQRNQLRGAEEVDGAVLRDAIQPYLGDDGPVWDYAYVKHAKGLVLAVIVNPPQWGDRMHTCRKAYSDDGTKLSVSDGDILVRALGQTRRANSHEIALLETRRDRSPSRDVQVSVEYGDRFDRVDSSSVAGLIGDTIDETVVELLLDVPTQRRSSLQGLGIGSLTEEQRSPDTFRQSVESWCAAAQKQAGAVAEELLRHQLARGVWQVTNESSRYLEAVRVQIQFPAEVRVLMESDAEYCDHGGAFDPKALLPEPPLPWGRMTQLRGITAPRFDPKSLQIGRRVSEFEVEATELGPLVTWHLGDLRPGSTESGDERFAVFTDEHLHEVLVHWRVTARGIDHVYEGQSNIACAQEAADHLAWQRVRPAEDTV